MRRRSPTFTLFPYTTLFRSRHTGGTVQQRSRLRADEPLGAVRPSLDRKSTRLNSSHVAISYAVFCLKKKNASDPLDRGVARGLLHRPAALSAEVHSWPTVPA